MILLDTHLLVWLYEDPEKLVPMAVRRRLDQELLALSPFVRLELQYLYEVERISVPSQVIVDEMTSRLELTHTDPPWRWCARPPRHSTGPGTRSTGSSPPRPSLPGPR